jgi:hypothetical protein
MQTLPFVSSNDLVQTIYAAARLADLKDTVQRYPGDKEVRQAYENADAALFDPLFDSGNGERTCLMLDIPLLRTALEQAAAIYHRSAIRSNNKLVLAPEEQPA